MKRFLSFLACFAVLLALSPRAQAHLVYVSPNGITTAQTGATVNVGVYFEATENDMIYGWGQALMYDPAELTYTGYALGDNVVGLMGSNFFHPTPTTGTLGPTPWANVGRYDYSFNGVNVTSGNTYELYTMRFTFAGGLSGGTDVWLATADVLNGLDVFMDLASGYTLTTEFHVAGGPDYSAVPVPGAIWLFGPGILGLAGMRKRVFDVINGRMRKARRDHDG